MNFADYAAAALVTAASLSPDERRLNGTMGLVGKAGEIIDLYKKHWFQGHSLDPQRIVNEIGDCLWYIALIASQSGLANFDFDAVVASTKQQSKQAMAYTFGDLAHESSWLLDFYGATPYGTTYMHNNVNAGLWAIIAHLATIARDVDSDLNACAAANVAKLAKRYGGSFEAMKSIERKDGQ